MKLNRTVGKNCFAPPEDVKLVQAALSQVKGRTKFGIKPLWNSRKINGKNSKELVAAICCYQQMECLPVTGKIEPWGKCLNNLRRKIPANVIAKLTQAGGASSGISKATTQTNFRGRMLRAGNTFFPSQQLIEFLKGWEGFVAQADEDPQGYCTIGYGHLLYKSECVGTHPLEIKYATTPMTLAEGDQLLREKVPDFESSVRRWLGRTPVTQSMYDALVSLNFNTGGSGGPSGAPELWCNLRNGNFPEAAKEFLDIDNATNETTGLLEQNFGLTKRRRAESDMFLNGNYSGRP